MIKLNHNKCKNNSLKAMLNVSKQKTKGAADPLSYERINNRQMRRLKGERRKNNA